MARLLRIGLLLFMAIQPTALYAADIRPGPLVVRGDRDFPPYEFINADGQPDGFNIAPLEFGPNCLDASGDKVRCKDKAGNPIIDRLSAAGLQLTPVDADVFAGPFVMHDEANFNDFAFDNEQGGVGIDI